MGYWDKKSPRDYLPDVEDVEAELLRAQGGRCAICGRTPEQAGKVKKLVMDHDHETGQVGGLLCNACNLALGMFRDDEEVLRNAILYLIRRSESQHWMQPRYWPT